MNRILSILVFISVLSSCVTSVVVFDVQRAGDITLPQEIQNIIIVNRSRPSKVNFAGNIIEGIVSGEGIGHDRNGAEYCIKGLSDVLLNSDRYTLMNTNVIELKGTGADAFPSPLDWNDVISICSSYGGDALLVLETFDTDSRVVVGAPTTITSKRKGVKITEARYNATLIMEIQSGWRIYDVYNKNIVDENRFIEKKDFIAFGSSADAAARNLPTKSMAIKESGILAGKQYGFRISPVYIKVRRAYFTGKNHNLKLAKSHIKSDDWDTAIEIWRNLVNNSDNKTARRSAYNMAVASEIMGRFDAAIDWANKAKNLGEKKAKKYINVLHIRKINEEKLQQQLNN